MRTYVWQWVCVNIQLFLHIYIPIHVYMSCYFLHYYDMGWLQLVGSIKLQVSFAKEPYKRDDILQKRPIILSILLTVATP